VSRSKSRSKLALASKVVQAVDVVQDVVQDTVLVPVTSQKIFPVSDFVSQRVVPQQLIISTVVASPSSPFERSSSSSSGFDVFVRKRGVFSKINKGALTMVGARDLGALMFLILLRLLLLFVVLLVLLVLLRAGFVVRSLCSVLIFNRKAVCLLRRGVSGLRVVVKKLGLLDWVFWLINKKDYSRG